MPLLPGPGWTRFSLNTEVSSAMSERPGMPLPVAETVRAACLNAALLAYEDAGIRGLCAEGRWEAAIDAMRELDLSALVHASAGSAPVEPGR